MIFVSQGGQIAWAQMGDPNASIPTPQPVFMRPMFAAKGFQSIINYFDRKIFYYIPYQKSICRYSSIIFVIRH